MLITVFFDGKEANIIDPKPELVDRLLRMEHRHFEIKVGNLEDRDGSNCSSIMMSAPNRIGRITHLYIMKNSISAVRFSSPTSPRPSQ